MAMQAPGRAIRGHCGTSSVTCNSSSRIPRCPRASLFGPEPGRVAPTSTMTTRSSSCSRQHAHSAPLVSIRPFTYETLFGLMASTGLRVSEAIHLRDADVDLKRGMLTIRQTKFAKSRQVPDPSERDGQGAGPSYRRQRERHLPTTAGMPFLISSRGRRLGLPLGDRQAHPRLYRPARQPRLDQSWRTRGPPFA